MIKITPTQVVWNHLEDIPHITYKNIPVAGNILVRLARVDQLVYSLNKQNILLPKGTSLQDMIDTYGLPNIFDSNPSDSFSSRIRVQKLWTVPMIATVCIFQMYDAYRNWSQQQDLQMYMNVVQQVRQLYSNSPLAYCGDKPRHSWTVAYELVNNTI